MAMAVAAAVDAMKLKEISGDKQVIVVTHLAQIAAYANRHYLIAKSVSDKRTFTSVTPLDLEGRKKELARIIGGANITDNTYKNGKGKITFDGPITEIGDNAFAYCARLKEVYCKATTPPMMGASVFADTDLESIYVPTASVDAYKDNDGWIRYSDIIFGYDF